MLADTDTFGIDVPFTLRLGVRNDMATANVLGLARV